MARRAGSRSDFHAEMVAMNAKASFLAAWRRLSGRKEFVRPDVSEGLGRFALDMFLLNLEACRRRLLSR